MGDSPGVAANLIDLGRTLRETGAPGSAPDSWAEASAVLAGLRADLAGLTGVRVSAGPR